MTIEISTAIIISVLSLGFSVFMGLKSNKRTDNTDLEERVRENTRINMKLDAISNNTTEIKNEVSEMRKEINSHETAVMIVSVIQGAYVLAKAENSTVVFHQAVSGLDNLLNSLKAKN